LNAQLEVDQTNGLIGVKCLKDLSAGDEVLIPFGMASWAIYFRYNWKNIKEMFHNLLMKKAKEVNSIDDLFANTVSNNYHICRTIANKLDEFECWQNGVQYPLTHFIETRGNSYINAFYQCLSHIPALTRVILETNIFDNMLDPINNPLSQYITQLMKNNNLLEDDSLDPFTIKLNDNVHELISSEQNLGINFIVYILDHFKKSCRMLDIVKHHLFEFYNTQEIYCMDHSHCVSIRKRMDIIALPFHKPEYQPINISNLIKTYILTEEQIDNYECPHCLNNQTGRGRTVTKFLTFPRVLLVALNRIDVAKGEIIDNDAEYSRYLKLQGDKEEVVHYQLIGTIVYYKETFISYFLHSDKKWYKDDGQDIIEVTAFEACNQPKAYILINKKIIEDIQQISELPEIVDMIMDSYGKSTDNQVAISLQLPIGKNRGVLTQLCRDIIKKYENKNCKSFKEFRHFIDENKLNIHIWRYHNKKAIDHAKMFNSCVNNGTSGFQLDYLLRERIVDKSHTSAKSKDQYMNANHKIITPRHRKEFDYYLGVLLDNKNYFPNLKKPLVLKIYGNNIIKNTFSSYENWIIMRTKQHKKKEISDDIYNTELAYYKIISARKWLKSLPSLNTSGEYPELFSPELGLHIKLWWDNNLFNLTSYDHDFSIFFNNEGVDDIPYIQNYYILQYTTICKTTKYDYTIPDAHNSITDQNHGALDDNHYHLLTTHLFDTATKNCLIALYENMNYIIMYGEFKYPLYESFNRWGGRIDFPRNYLTVPPKTSIRNIDTETIFTGIDLNSYSNSKLIMDMETAELLEMKAEQLQKQKNEELSINKNEIIYKTIDPQFSMNQIVSTQKSVVSETE